MSENNNQIALEVVNTKQWLEEIIIGLNFCPFAKKEFVNNTICYHLSEQLSLKKALKEVVEQCNYLIDNPDIETSLLIYKDGFKGFEQYLDLVDYSNECLIDFGFEGQIQIASFHPDYYFEGEDFDDPSNFTNRSPYPTIHLIREESMEKVLKVYKNPEKIPDNNIELARQKGSDYFKSLLAKLRR